MDDVACVVLDWKRPQNMPTVLNALRRQEGVNIRIYVIHQENMRKYKDCENIWLERNYCCAARWLALPLIRERYTVFVDDDIELTDPGIVALLVRHLKTLHHVSAAGSNFGDDPERPYTSGEKVWAPEEPAVVDVCLGNLNAVITREAANRWISALDHIKDVATERPNEMFICTDDIITSWLYVQAGMKNYAAGRGEVPYRVLDTAHGLEHRSEHPETRDRICRVLGYRKTTPKRRWWRRTGQ